ncbi:MAG: MBL fold metallo-hydrolase [Nitrospira sp.]|nr:MBL fold metallo-hydrolase [Nitrospira sp.]
MPLEDDFCDIIKKARTGLGLSIGEVAAKSGLPPGDITVLERAGRQPTRAEVAALATVLGLRPEPLAQIALEGWQPADPPALACVETVLGDVGGYLVKGYVLYDEGEAIMVDTAYHAEAMLDVVNRKNLTLKAVCLTHGHSDHADGLDVILQHLQAPVYIGREDVKLLPWKPPQKLMGPSEDGRTIAVGGLTVTCMTTPGHTPGGICYRVQRGERELCFVGDTLFAGSIGRANPATLYPAHLESVRTKVLTQPAQMVLLPGHGPATTVGEELVHNPFAEGSKS